MPDSQSPSFDLWFDPWITLERAPGGVTGDAERLGIEQTLLRAHEFRAVYDPSPLVVVGIHRLLIAVLQAAFAPQRPAEVGALYRAGAYGPEKIHAFGERYAARFDLFSAEAPFLQSADLPLQPQKGDDLKSVSILTAETSRGTALEHYRHGRNGDECFCPRCAACGLVTIPAFVSSGGRGLKPSINGVPPIYVLPGGETLFHSLAASLIAPNYQPKVRAQDADAAWWDRAPIVRKSQEVTAVGYLHSLTFPARRVRLHPVAMDRACTRCGETQTWGVRTLIFEMGESRPKGSPFWQDPFVAYHAPNPKEDKPPTPIRPQEGKVLWREFTGLFVKPPKSVGESAMRRPRVLDHIGDLNLLADCTSYPFRCVGVRTDMKAKVHEWLDADFDVPAGVLNNWEVGGRVEGAIGLAGDAAHTIADVFRAAFSRSTKQERHAGLKTRMTASFWNTLSEPFREFVLRVGAAAGDDSQQAYACAGWADTVVRVARAAFATAAEDVGDDGASLRARAQGEAECDKWLMVRRKKYRTKEGIEDG